jgi:hypothetical protein
MGTILIWFAIVVTSAGLGCQTSFSTPTAATNSTPPANAIPLDVPPNTVGPTERRLVSASMPINFIGCWTGEKGGGLSIAHDTITHYDGEKEHIRKYKLRGSAIGKAVLIDVIGTGPMTFLRPIMSIRSDIHDNVTNLDRILVFGFDSHDDFLADRFRSAGRFYLADCERELRVAKPKL